MWKSLPISCVLLELTTHCDQRCPECCCGIGINRKLEHHDWPYFERAAEHLRGVDRIHLTGGEPTLHPQFADFVPRLKPLFGCRVLTLQTDGYGVERHREIIEGNIDQVYFSDYHRRPAARAALVEIGKLTAEYDAGVDAVNFTPRSRRGSGQPCERAFGECVVYADGKLYGCCVAPGVDGSEGITPAADWKEAVRRAPLPCASCWFSP